MKWVITPFEFFLKSDCVHLLVSKTSTDGDVTRHPFSAKWAVRTKINVILRARFCLSLRRGNCKHPHRSFVRLSLLKNDFCKPRTLWFFTNSDESVMVVQQYPIKSKIEDLNKPYIKFPHLECISWSLKSSLKSLAVILWNAVFTMCVRMCLVDIQNIVTLKGCLH